MDTHNSKTHKNLLKFIFGVEGLGEHYNRNTNTKIYIQRKMQERTFVIIVLILVIVAYLLIGALLFEHLECGAEEVARQSYVQLFKDFASRLNISASSSLMKDVIEVHEKACSIGMPNPDSRVWSFTGSFYFAGTVLTTIGKYS